MMWSANMKMMTSVMHFFFEFAVKFCLVVLSKINIICVSSVAVTLMQMGG